MRSLRVGFEKIFSRRTSLDFEVTVSRTRGSLIDKTTRYEEKIWVYPDSTRTLIEMSTDEKRTNPIDKDVLEANLFLHLDGDRGGLSLRFSFLSGEAVKEYLSEYMTSENDSIVRQYTYRTSTSTGWSGGLIGIGGSHELGSRPLSLYWGGFYGFLRGWQNYTILDEDIIGDDPTTETSHEKDRWNTHVWQFNMASEYDVTESIQARLGGRVTALMSKGTRHEDLTLVSDEADRESEWDTKDLDLITNAGLTAGLTLQATDWLKIDLYTPDLSSLESWIFESFVNF